jgi:hypothetical protein
MTTSITGFDPDKFIIFNKVKLKIHEFDVNERSLKNRKKQPGLLYQFTSFCVDLHDVFFYACA